MASDNKVVSDIKLQKIVDKLRAIKDRQQLNEEQTKNGFILPLFAALGYDVFDIFHLKVRVYHGKVNSKAAGADVLHLHSAGHSDCSNLYWV